MAKSCRLKLEFVGGRRLLRLVGSARRGASMACLWASGCVSESGCVGAVSGGRSEGCRLWLYISIYKGRGELGSATRSGRVRWLLSGAFRGGVG